MSFFARLLALATGAVLTEDVLTEVIAHLFRLDWRERRMGRHADGAIVILWLTRSGGKGLHSPRAVRIETQRGLRAISGHSVIPDHPVDSRPDLVIEIDSERGSTGATSVFYIESKVDSGEGDRQLPRYAEHLEAQHGGGHLIYLTKRYDPKEDGYVRRYAPNVTFVQSRWHHVWGAVRDARVTAPPPLKALYDDVLSFLSHLGMDHDPRLTPADLLALGQAPRTYAFLDETLTAGTPSPATRLSDLVGKLGRGPSLAQIRNHNRYPIYKTFGQTHAFFEVLLGYWFLGDELPRLGLQLGSLSESGGGGEIAALVQTLSGVHAESFDEKWTASENGSWQVASVSRPLAPLLGAEDHVEAIRSEFMLLLDELSRVMALPAFSALPWTAPGVDDAGDE